MPLKEHPRSWRHVCHTGNYIYALQEKEKYHKMCKTMKGKPVEQKENKKNKKGIKNLKRKKSPLFDYQIMILI